MEREREGFSVRNGLPGNAGYRLQGAVREALMMSTREVCGER